MPAPPPDVKAFLATVPEGAKATLATLREDILAAAPNATERIGYGVPAFYHRGRPLVSYGATKNHCAFYVQSPAVMESHASDVAGFDTSKGTIRFPADAPLPADLVAKLVAARILEIDEALAT
jgi:uncharacterized protein YdhG (YjbR/CyaY superfamily)